MKISLYKPRTDYRICPNCGGALDPGESCDCHRPKQRIAGILEHMNPLHELFSKKRMPNGCNH